MQTYQYYKVSVTKTLDNITSNVADNAAYGKDFQFTLAAEPGYSPPASLTISSGAKTLAESADYTYSGTSGAVNVKGLSITGDVTIAASGVPNKYNISLNGNGATVMGTTAVNATFGDAMPAINVPSQYIAAAISGQKEKSSMTILRDLSVLWSLIHVLILFIFLYESRYPRKKTMILTCIFMTPLIVLNVWGFIRFGAETMGQVLHLYITELYLPFYNG